MSTYPIDSEQDAITHLSRLENLALGESGVSVGSQPDEQQRDYVLDLLQQEVQHRFSKRLRDAIVGSTYAHPIDSLERMVARTTLNPHEQICWGLCFKLREMVRH